MKKHLKFLNIIKSFCLIAILIFSLASCKKKEKPSACEKNGHQWIMPTYEEPKHCKICGITEGEPLEKVDTKPTKHLILDQNGNYGGTINRSKYGYGTPLNGEFDHLDTPYYQINDYYQLSSTESRTIFNNFQPYQQTMADSGGIACSLMLLNYLGEDVRSTYTEVNLVERYEELNHKAVYQNGTTSDGLIKLFTSLGYKANPINYIEIASNTTEKISDFNDWIKEIIDQGKFVFVRYHDTISFGWHLIIGYDSMGTAYSKDDVLIFADPYDTDDHYQDGYSISPSGRFYRWWLNVDLAGNTKNQFDGFIVEPKEPITFNRITEEPKIVQIVPNRYLLLNPDGSFGGTRDESKYGTIPEKNGETDSLTSIYHSFVDYYNLTNTLNRSILTNFKVFQQTMASSCGICSTLAVLNYYGEDINYYDEVWLTEKYCVVNDKETIKNVGVGSGGLKKLVATIGYNSEARSYSKANYVNESSMVLPTYELFTNWVKNNLSKNTPMPVSWRPQGGHWEVIIGYDTMGTDYIYDDVIVLADPHDTFDHYQDGYNTLPAHLFYRQWYNGSFTYNQQYNIFDRK